MSSPSSYECVRKTNLRSCGVLKKMKIRHTKTLMRLGLVTDRGDGKLRRGSRIDGEVS